MQTTFQTIHTVQEFESTTENAEDLFVNCTQFMEGFLVNGSTNIVVKEV